jgi:hypothetical protein
MAESGCLRNENVLNLNVNGIILGQRRPVKLLVNRGGAGALDAITAAESGTIFLVPALTSGTQTIALPACADAVGCTYTFILTATAAQIFKVEANASEKIVALKPKGDGDNTAAGSTTYDSIGFKAAAVIGSSFKLVCMSSTAATAWYAHDVIDGLAANVGSIDLA